jgi:hypothetical protein
VVAAEGLGELRRLPVAHPPGDLGDREVGRLQQGRTVLHAHGGELVAERAAR